MKPLLAACWFAVALTGCVSDRDASYAPGGTKTIIPFAVDKWKAPVLLANHLFYDRESKVVFDIEITSIDGKAFSGDGQRTKFYYQIDPGPHVIAVSCKLEKVQWVAEFDFVLDPGDTAEITGAVTDEGLVLWFAEVNTGRPLSEKIVAINPSKKESALP